MTEPTALFEDAIGWLNQHYAEFHFFLERDVVWTIQKHLLEAIDAHRLPYRVNYNHDLLGSKQHWADLTIINSNCSVEVAIEVKYEPSHQREDISHTKLPVVEWPSVCRDVSRVQRYVNEGKAISAYSFFLDEGRFFGGKANYPAPPSAEWRDWNLGSSSLFQPSVLWSNVSASLSRPNPLI